MHVFDPLPYSNRKISRFTRNFYIPNFRFNQTKVPACMDCRLSTLKVRNYFYGTVLLLNMLIFVFLFVGTFLPLLRVVGVPGRKLHSQRRYPTSVMYVSNPVLCFFLKKISLTGVINYLSGGRQVFSL